MNELVIKTHDFEVAKKGLKEFSEQTKRDLNLEKVNSNKGVGEWFGDYLLGGGISVNHKVTGAELNELMSQVQKHLIDINNMNIRSINEFGQVYNALEALDKDYIQDILISIKATEETSKGIETAQKEIKVIIDDQKRTLEILKNFKRKLDNYAHLSDIDRIWSDCQKWHKEITTLSNSINNVLSISNENAHKFNGIKTSIKTTDGKIEELEKSLDHQIAKIESVITFICILEQITHLRDIDEMWDSLSSAHKSLLNICDDLNSIRVDASNRQADVENLLRFTEALSGYAHLQDIDELWSRTEAHSVKLDILTQQSNSALELANINQGSIEKLLTHEQMLRDIVHLNDVNELWDSNETHSNQLSELEEQGTELTHLIQSNTELMDAAIAAAIAKSDTAVQVLTKKIQYAYLIAGGSLGLALIELVVIFLQVI